MERSAVNENILIRLLSSLKPLYVSFSPQTMYVYHKTQHLKPWSRYLRQILDRDRSLPYIAAG